jgi:Tfp pilus assembly protein FimT
MWSNRAAGENTAAAGFVLVEVLVALGVAAILLVALMRAFATIWAGIGVVREEAEAMLIARSLLYAATPRSNMVEGVQNGSTGRYGWTVSISKAPQAAPAAPAAATETEADAVQPWTAFIVAINVKAPNGRSTSLETIRLARTAR